VTTEPARTPTYDEILALNHQEYDDANDPYWNLTVYQPFHAGWRFTNVGGRRVLDRLAHEAPLVAGSEVLELCSGMGDTCRYLAQQHGCHVTGVEMNARQYQQALATRASLDPELAARLRYVHADLLAWRPDDAFDAAYSIDALMFLDERDTALRTAHAALRPAALLLLGEVIAGPHLTPEVREFIWEEDGILKLPDADAQTRLLVDCGFTEVQHDDWSDMAERCFATMEVHSLEHRQVLVEAKGVERYERWLRNAGLYRAAFRTGALAYGVFSARRQHA
jgi:cyclopropane fatty-acyl-phospholipid synthase-like methyltransferase